MKKYFVSFLLLVLFVGGASAQKTDPVQDRLRTDITYLASDKLEGRRTGEKSAVMAADYIAARFADLKLKAVVQQPMSGKNTKGYKQLYPFYSGVALGADNGLKITLPNMSAAINLESNWMPVGFSSDGAVAQSDIVFAGYGIVSDEAKFDDYKGLDVTGKIVLVFDGTPDSDNPHSPFYRFSDARVKAKIARDKGAKALLIISGKDKLSDDRLALLKFDQSMGDTAVPTAVVARSIGAMLLGDNSEEDLKRDEQWIALRKDAGEIGMNLSNRPKASAELKVDLVKKLSDTYNVIGVLEGTDPQLKNEAIIIGAHFDHLGHGGPESLAPNSTEIHHGADDNASGTAAVMELAREFAAAKNNKRTLIFMCFSGEEEGLLGSKAYTNMPVFPLDKTVTMINMDMVGRMKDNKLNVQGIGTASEWKDLVNSKNPQASAFALQLADDGFGPSDHSSFYAKQIPVLFFFTGSHEDYHKPSDTADKINYAGESRVISYMADIIKSIDQNPAKPTYTVAKSSGMNGRPAFAVTLGVMPNYSESGDGMGLDAVNDNSPAAKAGLKPGDKVIMLAGKEVRNAMDYTQILGGLKANQEYEVVVMRGTEKITLKVTPAARK
jgi:aminopeptidase YwaD